MPSPHPDIGAAARAVQALAIALLIGGRVTPAAGVDPLAVARTFCQADGRGARLGPGAWAAIAPLAGWSLEPAWDHVRLISGYQLGESRSHDGQIDVDVQYSVVADVDADGVRSTQRTDTRTLTLEADGDGGWRLRGPPPPPYVFESEADAERLASLLDPANDGYLSNSGFIWRLLRDAGWEIPHADTDALPRATGFRAERSANVGDLALYYDRDTPYHVAMVESDDRVVSATLNGGLRRTPFGAFAGEIRYLRPVKTSPSPGVTPTP